MKKRILVIFCLFNLMLTAQTITNNRNPVGLEHNMLFNASSRYQVSQGEHAKLDLIRLFDGKFTPSYTSSAPTVSQPTTVLIEGLPANHTQAGAWIGWSTRYWPSTRFKIEGYDVYNSINSWRVIADYSNQNYTSTSFLKKIPTGGKYTKLRFTFYEASGSNGRLGVSELYFIHPEAVSPYEGLFSTSGNSSLWQSNGSNIYYSVGNIAIGTSSTGNHKLAVEGSIGAREVKVEASGWSDFVFYEDYQLPTLNEVENHIKEKGHLKDIPSAEKVKQDGFFLGEMDAKLLQKIEELTLYTIQQQKELNEQQKELEQEKKKNTNLEARLTKLEELFLKD